MRFKNNIFYRTEYSEVVLLIKIDTLGKKAHASLNDIGTPSDYNIVIKKVE